MNSDPTYRAVEREDERDRDHLALSIFESFSTHVARVAAARQYSRNDSSHLDLVERIERLEATHELEQTAKYVIWDLDTKDKRVAYLTEYQRRHGKDQYDDLMNICKRLAARHFVDLAALEDL